MSSTPTRGGGGGHDVTACADGRGRALSSRVFSEKVIRALLLVFDSVDTPCHRGISFPDAARVKICRVKIDRNWQEPARITRFISQSSDGMRRVV